MTLKMRNATPEFALLFLIFFFIWTPMDAQNDSSPCGLVSSSCLGENSTTDYDEKINTAILNKIKQRYSITTHKLILCIFVSKFTAVIDSKGEKYIYCPSAYHLDKLLEGSDWKITGEFLHAIAHLKIGNLADSSEINADIETAGFLKLAGATYEQAIMHLNDITITTPPSYYPDYETIDPVSLYLSSTFTITTPPSYYPGSGGSGSASIIVPKSERLKEYRKVYGINDFDVQRREAEAKKNK